MYVMHALSPTTKGFLARSHYLSIQLYGASAFSIHITLPYIKSIYVPNQTEVAEGEEKGGMGGSPIVLYSSDWFLGHVDSQIKRHADSQDKVV